MTLDLQKFRRGWFEIDAVQLTKANRAEVCAWSGAELTAESEGTDVTVINPSGRFRAVVGDWIYRTPGGWFHVWDDPTFRENYALVKAGDES